VRSPAAAADAARCAAALARGLSAGRRAGCVLTTPQLGSFGTDLRDVFVAWPPPTAARRHERGLAACLAFQCSPTKEAAAELTWLAFSPREIAALQLVEGAAAFGWIAQTWPGLVGAIRALAPDLDAEPWEGLTGAELAERARRLARSRRGALEVPDLLGDLHVLGQPDSGFTSMRKRLSGHLKIVGDALERIGGRVGEPIAVEGEDESGDPPHGAPLDGGEADGGKASAGGGIPFPEWNLTTQAYREDFTRIFESRLGGDGSSSARRSHELEGWFSAPIDRRWAGRLPEGGDIDVDGVVDALADRLTGHDASDRVYRERLRSERDVACAVLIDGSGSLAQAAQLRHEIACADALVDAMAAAGERHAVFSFWSNTRHHVSLQVLSDFGDATSCPSASVVRPAHHTRLGAALRAVTARLLREPAGRRVLLVLTDGLPFDDGYEGAYACADVAKAVEEAELHDIAVAIMCLSAPERTPLSDWLVDELHFVPRLRDLAPVLGDVHFRLAA
jgi:hypothetical protein